jgi:hypothetical protein
LGDNISLFSLSLSRDKRKGEGKQARGIGDNKEEYIMKANGRKRERKKEKVKIGKER